MVMRMRNLLTAVAVSAVAAASGCVETAGPFLTTSEPRVVFISSRDGAENIYSMNSDGTGVTRLTTTTRKDSRPAWSADGTKIVFQTNRDGNNEIYVMNADGSDQHNVTRDPANDENPVWSPDGARIAFSTNRDGNKEIYTINPDGSGAKRLTDFFADDT